MAPEPLAPDRECGIRSHSDFRQRLVVGHGLDDRDGSSEARRARTGLYDEVHRRADHAPGHGAEDDHAPTRYDQHLIDPDLEVAVR
jgi:hypothetical protein